jgi:polyisoprenoid-binding protein YceI
MPFYAIDPARSEVGFSVRHMMFAKVRGRFTRWTADLIYDEDDVARSSVEAKIEAASVDTHDSLRDAFLRSDFFDVAAHPFLTYQSKRVEAAARNHFRVVGDLTIRGVAREVALEVDLLGKRNEQLGDEKVAFRARASVSRKDWGLKWNQALEAGGVLVGEKVDVELYVEGSKIET